MDRGNQTYYYVKDGLGSVVKLLNVSGSKEKRPDLPERTFQFALRMVKLCQFLDKKPGISQTITRQLVRSGTSIGANIEEGQGSQSEADFLTKYSIACKEARETHYWLRLLVASEIVPEKQIGELLKECEELIAILTTICKKVKEKKTQKTAGEM